MVVQAPEFEVTPLQGTASVAVSIGGQRIGLITYEADCGWTAIFDDQSRTCETLHEAIDFIKTVWEPGLPPTPPNLGHLHVKAAERNVRNGVRDSFQGTRSEIASAAIFTAISSSMPPSNGARKPPRRSFVQTPRWPAAR